MTPQSSATDARTEFFGGLLLATAAVAALAVANSPWAEAYRALLDLPAVVGIGSLAIQKPLLSWINDGLMAVFFFQVGLEIKRELVAGELSRPGQLVLPALAALGGMAAPALVFIGLAGADPEARAGWAIPSATDIAFALGVLGVFGARVPPALKLFLMSVAVLDDLGAIVVIATFYTSELSTLSLALAGAALALLVIMNRSGVARVTPYLLVGFFMWTFVLKSGVHATLAGVLLALSIPLRTAGGREPTRALEHELHPWVGLFIVPVFAFANAGLPLGGLTAGSLLAPATLGIALGLFLGKQLGVFGASFLLVRAGVASLPAGARWSQLYGVSLLCGIGFTMSLFIATLAWPPGSPWIDQARLGILLGTLLSAVTGLLVLARVLPRGGCPGGGARGYTCRVPPGAHPDAPGPDIPAQARGEQGRWVR